MNAVYSCNWYMEHRMHLCWSINWEATLSWKECCSPAGFDDWSSWNPLIGYHITGINFSLLILCFLSSFLFLLFSLSYMAIITAIYFNVQVRNDKARRYLTSMRKKLPVSFAQKFPNADPLALRLLQRLLAFDPKDRPTAEEVSHIILKIHHHFVLSAMCISVPFSGISCVINLVSACM